MLEVAGWTFGECFGVSERIFGVSELSSDIYEHNFSGSEHD